MYFVIEFKHQLFFKVKFVLWIVQRLCYAWHLSCFCLYFVFGFNFEYGCAPFLWMGQEKNGRLIKCVQNDTLKSYYRVKSEAFKAIYFTLKHFHNQQEWKRRQNTSLKYQTERWQNHRIVDKCHPGQHSNGWSSYNHSDGRNWHCLLGITPLP